jgi:hypothetical protein
MLHIVVGGRPEGTCPYTTPSFKPKSTYITRVPQCLSPRPNWDLRFPLPQAGESRTPETKGGGGHIRLRVSGWEVPVRTTGVQA